MCGLSADLLDERLFLISPCAVEGERRLIRVLLDRIILLLGLLLGN
jgi:hypothetical protein